MGNDVVVRFDAMADGPARLLSTVVRPGEPVAPGGALPALWHWAYFPELSASGELGSDGHPRRSDEFAARFPRRMAGGGAVRARPGLVLGEAAERRSELVEATERTGSSGTFVVCDWRHTFIQAGREVLEERQSVLYLPARASKAPARRATSATGDAGDAGPWRRLREVAFDEATLFRFSAATWNAHRIHYDRDFAVAEEGYPGLVVHGPLLTMLLAGEAERALGPGLDLTYRSLSPVFDADTVEFFAHLDGEGSAVFESRKPDGTVTTRLGATRARGKGAGDS